MTATELDTFIQKFKQLCKACLSAHLDLNTCAGQAWWVYVSSLDMPLVPFTRSPFIKKLLHKGIEIVHQDSRARRSANRQRETEKVSNDESNQTEHAKDASKAEKALIGDT